MKATTITKIDPDEAEAMRNEMNRMIKTLECAMESLLTEPEDNGDMVKGFLEESVCEEQPENIETIELDLDYLHDHTYKLRGALTPALGWSQVLLSRKLNEAQTVQALQSIRRSAFLLLKIIQDFESRTA